MINFKAIADRIINYGVNFAKPTPSATGRRSAIKSAVSTEASLDDEIPYTTTEQAIIDRFEALPGKCKRKASRTTNGISSWGDLVRFCNEHEIVGHNH